MNRKSKLRFIQFSLLVVGVLTIVLTYSDKRNNLRDEIISTKTQKKIKEQLANQTPGNDIFFNIEYSGLDLAGNRYILKSKQAYNAKNDQEIINMQFVEASFYFKDKTILKVWSEEGVYNNKTLDMTFSKNVKAIYEDSVLFAQRAEYSNANSFLTITEDVKINDIKGTMFADKLLFDIKKQTLNIASFKNNKVNANIDLK